MVLTCVGVGRVRALYDSMVAGIFSKEFCRVCHFIHFHPSPKPAQNFQREWQHSENHEKVKEKGCWRIVIHKVETLSSSNSHRVVHTNFSMNLVFDHV